MVTRGAARRLGLVRVAPLDVDLLLAHVLGVSREALLTHPDAPLPPDALARFDALLARRAAGEPLAYLRGVKEFYGLELAVDPRVLVPRPETEALVEAALAFVRRTGARTLVDVGTGSGAIAVALAVSAPSLTIVATDVSDDALAVARANAARHGVAARLALRSGDLLAPVGGPVDVVTANLPYLRDDAEATWTGERRALRHEPRVALLGGADGLVLVRRLIADLPRVLGPRGAAYLEIDPPQAAEVARLLVPLGGAVRIVPDLTGEARVVALERA